MYRERWRLFYCGHAFEDIPGGSEMSELYLVRRKLQVNSSVCWLENIFDKSFTGLENTHDIVE